MAIQLSGSLELTGSITATGGITISGSIASSSFAVQAQTASSADNLTVRSTLTAQTLVVQTITSSVDFITGSTRFGSLSSNTHQFTGSVYVTGAFYVTTGSVGIGTTSPDTYSGYSVLQVGGSVNGIIQAYDGTVKTAVTSNGSGYGIIGTRTNHDLRVFTNDTVKMIITNGGNVGIGTTSPSGSLSINAASSNTPNIRFQNNLTSGLDAAISNYSSAGQTFLSVGTNYYMDSTGSASKFKTAYEGSTLLFDGGNFYFYSSAANGTSSTKMTITTSGSVGIGTSAPGSILHVKGGSAGGADFGAELRVWENSFGAVLQGSTVGSTEAFLGNFRYNFNTPASSVTNYLSAGHGILFYDGVHIFASSPGGTSGGTFTPTERMTVLNGGNIGIGTTNPAHKLDVAGDRIRIKSSGNYGGFLADNTSGTGGGFYAFYKNGTAIGYLGVSGAILGDTSEDTMLYADGSSAIRVYTSNLQRIYVSTGGRTQLSHSTSDLDTLYVVNGSASPYGMNITFSGAAPVDTTHNFLYFADYSSVRFKVTSNGNAYNQTGTYTSGVSDIRYKEQVVDANSQWDDIKNLRVVNFKFKKDVQENGENALRQIGFIAQEVEQVSPNLIDEMSDKETGESWKTIKTSIIHTKAIKALQEAMARIEILEAKIEQLEQK